MIQSQHGAFPGKGAMRGAENSGDDLRMLAGVLNDIMPVLTRLQSRAPQVAGTRAEAPQSLETQAAVAFVSDLGADSLRRLTAYLDANAAHYDELENCASIVAAAARALAARDYAQAFTLLFEVYRTIAVLRAEDPRAPAPGSVNNPSAEDRPQRDETRAGDQSRDAPFPSH